MRTVIDIPVQTSARLVGQALEGLTRMAAEEIAGGGVPPLYKSGVRYEREAPGSEVWQLPSQVRVSGRGDCEDLAAWRAGELRATRADPSARVVLMQTGPKTLHAVVQRGDGAIEDPSRVLGMTVREGTPVPRMLVGVEPTHTWCEFARRMERGPFIASGPDLATALTDLDGFNTAGEGEVGFLDTIARAAQGALTAVVPGLAPQPAQGPAAAPVRVVQPAARPRPAVVSRPAVTSAAHALDLPAPDVLRVATALAKVIEAERRRDRRARAGRIL